MDSVHGYLRMWRENKDERQNSEKNISNGKLNVLE